MAHGLSVALRLPDRVAPVRVERGARAECPTQCFLAIKRLLDVAVSCLVLLVFTPLFPLIALFIKIDSRGPVLYAQRRLGKDEAPFMLLKFRTMVRDAEAATGPIWAAIDDPRLTRVGRVLRWTHLDELPQFVNVLLGQMSLVGPRPERPALVSQFERFLPAFRRRCDVKPGLTGLAQVRGRYRMVPADIRNKYRYDMFYIRKMCLLLDLQIFFQTLGYWLRSWAT